MISQLTVIITGSITVTVTVILPVVHVLLNCSPDEPILQPLMKLSLSLKP